MQVVEDLLRERSALRQRWQQRDGKVGDTLQRGASHVGTFTSNLTGGAHDLPRDASLETLITEVNSLIADIENSKSTEQSVVACIRTLQDDQERIRKKDAWAVGIVLILVVASGMVFVLS